MLVRDDRGGVFVLPECVRPDGCPRFRGGAPHDSNHIPSRSLRTPATLSIAIVAAGPRPLVLGMIALPAKRVWRTFDGFFRNRLADALSVAYAAALRRRPEWVEQFRPAMTNPSSRVLWDDSGQPLQTRDASMTAEARPVHAIRPPMARRMESWKRSRLTRAT